ncbi:hypothetical protein CKO25_10680 [Thiocapsa imhoffii]|uniref:Uncharacterized protein n=1 Tax=Thiocapsa imhoffii TaxID=382777 RepID=A0A9X1B8S4_9GAMM|nr:hypothetical protein [Thiocapsa imhoffii]MBK1645107.1 hypothetical protein [Thiocapsa imhoffii]
MEGVEFRDDRDAEHEQTQQQPDALNAFEGDRHHTDHQDQCNSGAHEMTPDQGRLPRVHGVKVAESQRADDHQADEQQPGRGQEQAEVDAVAQ